MGSKWLKNRKVLNLTDSAKTYRTEKIDGVKNFYIKHSHTKGRPPVYAKKFTALVPRAAEEVHLPKRQWSNKQVIKLKLGTQLADNYFKYMRKSVLPTIQNKNSRVIDSYVRSYQWRHSHWSKDLWLETAKAVERWYGDAV